MACGAKTCVFESHRQCVGGLARHQSLQAFTVSAAFSAKDSLNHPIAVCAARTGLALCKRALFCTRYVKEKTAELSFDQRYSFLLEVTYRLGCSAFFALIDFVSNRRQAHVKQSFRLKDEACATSPHRSLMPRTSQHRRETSLRPPFGRSGWCSRCSDDCRRFVRRDC